MKVKVSVKGRKDKVTTMDVKNSKDLEKLVVLAKSEAYRKNILKDIDYDDCELIFKIDGEKISAKDIIEMGMKKLNSISKDDDSKKDKKKKKKHKKSDNDDRSSDKKKKKKGKKDKDGKGKKKKKNGMPSLDIEDGCVTIHRI